ncbi:GSCOCG00012273001-RA-CDS, partial [Cotesia congregata]
PDLDVEILEILGKDPSKKPDDPFKFHAEIKGRWGAWMKEGLAEEVNKSVLSKYLRKGDLYAEPPKINLEIAPALSEITKKRDDHFSETQRCVGSAVIALGAAMSLLLDASDNEVDELKLMEYFSDTGKLLTEIFHQHSIARKSYITPVMKKGVKNLVDFIPLDEWLYGNKLAEQIKEVKTIESACQNLKSADKSVKKPSQRLQFQGNSRSPPANYRQMGTSNQRKTLRFKPKYQRPSQKSGQERTQTKDSEKNSLKQCWSFTKERNYDIHNTDEFKIIEFLTLRFNKGCKYGTLNSDKAAIALVTYENHSEEKLTKR